jgi:FkbM family methyltransferase
MYENWSYDADNNGEARLLAELSSELEVVFDVGANVGEWTQRVLDTSDATCHAFEIVPATATELDRRVTDPRVTVNHFGLSDTDGTVRVKVYPGFAQFASISTLDHGAGYEWRDCRVRRGDAYCRESGIDHIDFLKVDTEGADLAVLRGFGDMLGRVTAIQFEYGMANISSRALLADCYELLESHGHTVGKIFPNSVAFGPYRPEMEDFRGPNYLAVPRDRVDLIERLGGATT